MEKHKEIGREILEDCFAGRTRLLNRVITSAYDEELRALGLTANQLTILAIVASMEQVRPARLQEYLRMDQSTVSRNLKRMMRNGWLARVEGKSKRSFDVALAPGGHRLLERALPSWKRAQKVARQLLGESGLTSLKKVADPLLPGEVRSRTSK